MHNWKAISRAWPRARGGQVLPKCRVFSASQIFPCTILPVDLTFWFLIFSLFSTQDFSTAKCAILFYRTFAMILRHLFRWTLVTRYTCSNCVEGANHGVLYHVSLRRTLSEWKAGTSSFRTRWRLSILLEQIQI